MSQNYRLLRENIQTDFLRSIGITIDSTIVDAVVYVNYGNFAKSIHTTGRFTR